MPGVRDGGPSVHEVPACLDGFGRAEFGVEGGEESGDARPGPGAEGESAVVVIEVFDDRAAWCPTGDDPGRQVEPGLPVHCQVAGVSPRS